MKLQKKPKFIRSLQKITDYIALDKRGAAINFARELNKELRLLKKNPYMARASYYFDDASYRDFIFKGYTITYRVTDDTIEILNIFKWRDQ
jgi:plasmid stabilization system protein ParE